MTRARRGRRTGFGRCRLGMCEPRDALRHLEEKGFGTALVGDGDSVLKAFRDEGLADEIIFNITPEIAGPGNHVGVSVADVGPLKLLDFREVGGGCVRLHYSLEG